ncbi:MAG: porin [Gammaproteobacteria bacterium]|nr:porin [Gammaproteobacteria bacterium]MDH5801428.1 porin [Gammaproteobacteria bacterium]
MNKKLLTILVGSALACGASISQAEVTIYGKAHLSLDSLDNGTDSFMFVSSNSSRLGLKGDEDLGEGLKLMWQIESSVTADAGGGTIAGRNTFVGIGGNFGKVLLGQHDSPFKSLGRKADLFGDQVGDSRNLISGDGSSNVGFDPRLDDALVYMSPNFSGFTLSVALGQEDGVTDGGATSISGVYSNGPITAGVAIETHDAGLGGGADSESGTRIAGSYKMDAFKINALYQTLTDMGGTAGNDSTTLGVGGAFKMGKNAFKAQFYTLDTDAVDSNATMIALGFDHKLSKMTTVYAAYASTSNDANVAYSASGGGHGDSAVPPTAGDDSSALSFGIVHSF